LSFQQYFLSILNVKAFVTNSFALCFVFALKLLLILEKCYFCCKVDILFTDEVNSLWNYWQSCHV